MNGRQDLQQYLSIFVRWLWLIALCAAIPAGVTFYLNSRMTPIYQASTTLMVRQAPGSGLNEYNAILLSERLIGTYAEMLREGLVLEEVVEQLGLSESADVLRERVSVETVQDAQLIRLRVEHPDSGLAAAIADAIAEAFIVETEALHQARYTDSLAGLEGQMEEISTLINETLIELEQLGEPETADERDEQARLEALLAGYRNTYATLLQSYEEIRLTAAQSADAVSVLKPAQAPQRPIRPRLIRNTALAYATGGMVGLGIAFLIEYLDDKIASPEDVDRALGVNTLGVIPKFNGGKSSLVARDHPLSTITESFRKLRTNLQFSNVDQDLITLLVTSAGPTEGKSITVANLAVVMAQSGLRVAVVDADLRRPVQHKLFGVHPRGGLTESLVADSLYVGLQSVPDVEDLVLLPAGDRPPNPADLLGSKRMGDLLEMLANKVDVVLIDSPPVLPVADGVVLAQRVDGVLVVVDAGETRHEIGREGLEHLRKVGANVVGVVLNRAIPGEDGAYYYYSGYYGENGNGKEKRGERQTAVDRRRVADGG